MRPELRQCVAAVLLCFLWTGPASGAAPLSVDLPPQDGVVEIPTMEWPLRPGPRSIAVHVRYPGGHRDQITETTGLMLSLHNWGGTGFRGAPDPAALTDVFDLVVIGVDYLQSGPFEAGEGLPYDFGLYQAIDALQAVAWVWHSLDALDRAFAKERIYATGGSGGGNVALMANKLAPRSFAAIVDISGMAQLTDDIAYGAPGGSSLNAGYRHDGPEEQRLSVAAQMIRNPSHIPHLETMLALGNEAQVLSIHGSEDQSCLFADKEIMIAKMHYAGLKARLHGVYPPEFLSSSTPDYLTPHEAGLPPFKNAAHSLGDRTEILLSVAGAFLDPDSPECARRKGTADFERRDNAVHYGHPWGDYVVDYRSGYPALSFDAATE